MSKNRASIFVVFVLTISIGIFLVFHFFIKKENDTTIPKEINKAGISNGIHLKTGLKDGEGLLIVVAHCTACHSAELLIQNRMNEERWNATIRWMQETQNLWDLGDNQKVIVDYLVNNYPVENKGRRQKLDNIEWYELAQ